MKLLAVCTSALFVAACGDDAPPPPPVSAPIAAAPQAQPQPAPPPPPQVQAPKPDPNVELAARVKKGLDEAASELSQGIDVAVANGVVRLYGTVASAEARRRAAKIVGSTPGVTSVENKLVVVKGS